jgi:hypothetical protein
MKTLTAPEDQIIQVKSSEGKVLFEDDAIMLRALFDDATGSTKSVHDQYEKIKVAVKKKYGCEISPSTIYVIGNELDKVLVDLKKTTSI